MISLASYYVKDRKNLIASKDNVVLGERYRFSVLTDRLIRLEYSPNGVFEDRASQNVVFRNFPKVEYTVSQSQTLLQLTTKYFVLDYEKNKPFATGNLSMGSTLKVTLKETDRVWYYGQPEARNFGAISYSLDDFNGRLKLEKGLYSADGFAILNDSFTYVINENDEFVGREDKSMDIYLFMYRKDFGLCLKDYYELTGYPTLISRYALGNMWYKNDDYSMEEIRSLTYKFVDSKIPISAILLGTSNYGKDNYEFTKMVGSEVANYLRGRNIKLGFTINPSLPVTKESKVYNSVSSLLQNSDSVYKFIPFSNVMLNVYLNVVLRNLFSQGVDFFNIDYNNVKDKRTLALFNHYHQVSGEIMLSKRGLCLTRNSRIAVHRHSILFSGRTRVDWKTLESLPLYNVSASNIGVSYVAHAIGGYYGGIEDNELFCRYVQFGTFSPIFLLASEGGKYYKREPWKWDALSFSVISEYMRLRNKLIPYLYTEAYVYHKTGSPIVQPMYYQYPKVYDDPVFSHQYFFGSQMLVCPILKKKNPVMNRVVQKVFVPEGTWYDFRSGKKYNGNKYYLNFYKDEDYPVFCKEGSIIPLSLDNNHECPVNMEIQVFPGASGSYKLYEDDGITNNYEKGNYIVTSLDYVSNNNSYKVSIKTFEGKGSSIPAMRNYYVRFRNVKDNVVARASYSSVEVPCKSYADNNDLVVLVENVAAVGETVVTVTGDNILVDASKLVDEDILGILVDLEIDTALKDKVDKVLFSNMSIKKKRIAIRKLKRKGLHPKFIRMFINLFEYLEKL